MNRDNRIIGGMFGLPATVEPKVKTEPGRWKFLDESNLFLTNGRSGIKILIELLGSASIWMPSFFCPTMLDAVDQNKTTLKYYEVNYNLQIPSAKWVEEVKSGDIVVLIDYFGFPLDSKIASLVKEQEGWVLEDACQALLSEHVGRYSDFILFSPRKYIGVPDGGIVVSCCDVVFDDVELRPAPSDWWLKMLESAVNRREFDQHGGERHWYQLFQETNEMTPCGYFRMSELARQLMLFVYDYQEIARSRIENYLVLTDELPEFAVFPELPSGTVPLGFPVKDRQRDCTRHALFREQIYPPVHWAILGSVPEVFQASHKLAAHIMTLLCDQRYSVDEVRRMAYVFTSTRQSLQKALCL